MQFSPNLPSSNSGLPPPPSFDSMSAVSQHPQPTANANQNAPSLMRQLDVEQKDYGANTFFLPPPENSRSNQSQPIQGMTVLEFNNDYDDPLLRVNAPRANKPQQDNTRSLKKGEFKIKVARH